MFLTQLVYGSTAVEDVGMDFVDEILNQSRKHNEPKGVTGVLLLRGNQIFQVLEGERLVISDLYNRIAQDERHSNVVIYGVQEIQKRDFTNWAMGYIAPTNISEEAILRYNVTSQLAENTMSYQQVRKLIMDLVEVSLKME